jgi:hypothetical protein
LAFFHGYREGVFWKCGLNVPGFLKKRFILMFFTLLPSATRTTNAGHPNNDLLKMPILEGR